MMYDVRSGKIVLVAHCVLNQNARVSGLAYYPAVANEVVKLLIKHDVGIVQMQCPELTYAGFARRSGTREQYDTPRFRRHCKRIAEDLAKQVQEYIRNHVKVSAILGIEGSPSCGISESSGIMIEILKSELEKRNIIIPFREVNFKEVAVSARLIEKIVKT